MHVLKKDSLVKIIKCTTILGAQNLNQGDNNKVNSLYKNLKYIQSIYEKLTGRGESKQKTRDRYFYTVIQNSRTKSVSFDYTKANSREGAGFERGLPLFIHDFFKLKLDFFCSSDYFTESQSQWDFGKGTFVTEDEKHENDQLITLEESMEKQQDIYISKDHKRSLAMENDEVSLILSSKEWYSISFLLHSQQR